MPTLPLLIFGAYIIGFIPASVAGFFIGWRGIFPGGVGLAYALVVGALVGLVTGSLALFKPENAIALFLICLIATVVCWLPTRRWWREAGIGDTS